MNNYTFKRIYEKEEFIKVLLHFKYDLYTLRNDKINISEYAQKAITNGYAYVVYVGNNIAAFCVFYANDNEKHIGFLSMLAVDKNNRKNNLGTLFIHKIICVCIENKMNKLMLSVRNENEGAIAFYKKNGFCELEKNGDDAIFMIKDI